MLGGLIIFIFIYFYPFYKKNDEVKLENIYQLEKIKSSGIFNIIKIAKEKDYKHTKKILKSQTNHINLFLFFPVDHKGVF